MEKNDFREKVIHEIEKSKNQFNGTVIRKFEELINFLKNINSIVLSNQYTVPRKANLKDIEDTGEKAFQRAIFNSGRSMFRNAGIVKWIDLELPVIIDNPKVEGGKRTNRRIDLIGLIEDIPVICELKFVKIKRNNQEPPLYAIFELLTYYCSIWYNYKNLESNKVYHKFQKQDDFGSKFAGLWSNIIQNKPKLLVCANKSYWDLWEKKEGKKVVDIARELNDKLNVEILLLCTKDINFDEKKKKSFKASYDPSIECELTLEQFA
jgi:hypothetical protein